MAKTIVVDRTHMARRASGLERITDELFSPDALSGFAVESAEAPNRKSSIVLSQTLLNPLRALLRPDTIWIFPGFPPSPLFGAFRNRSVLYVHDLFLITRTHDLNPAGRYYMSPMFRHALRSFRHFLANSEATARELRPYIPGDATVTLYRPGVRNVFGLEGRHVEARSDSAPLVVGAVGTIEPRKNFRAAAEACQVLAERLGKPVEFHIVGRLGWGPDLRELASMPHVTMHGFLDDSEARRAIDAFDLLLCTSHDEGLGLPLLEVQYSGLPVVAPDRPVFREVLGRSGTFFAPGSREGAAAAMASLVGEPDWRRRHADAARRNLARWNEAAAGDRARVHELLRAMGAALDSRATARFADQRAAR